MFIVHLVRSRPFIFRVIVKVLSLIPKLATRAFSRPVDWFKTKASHWVYAIRCGPTGEGEPQEFDYRWFCMYVVSVVVYQPYLQMACYCVILNPTISLKPRKRTPYCLFGWNLGKRRDDLRLQPEWQLQPKYHDNVNLLFPLSLVYKTFLKGRELKCCYKASIDGFSATNFHECCDFKGPCVIIAYTNNYSYKFGGFNPEGYRSTDDYYDTFDAFLFYWPDNRGCEDRTSPKLGSGETPIQDRRSGLNLDNGKKNNDPIVLPKIGGSGAALFDYARGGPQFGADGLLIGPPLAPVMGGFAGPDTNSGVGDLRMAKSRLGLSYAKRRDGKESIFGDETRATVDDVLVFCSPQIASLY